MPLLCIKLSNGSHLRVEAQVLPWPPWSYPIQPHQFSDLISRHVSLLFFKRVKYTPASRTLHLLFLLPDALFFSKNPKDLLLQNLAQVSSHRGLTSSLYLKGQTPPPTAHAISKSFPLPYFFHYVLLPPNISYNIFKYFSLFSPSPSSNEGRDFVCIAHQCVANTRIVIGTE